MSQPQPRNKPLPQGTFAADSLFLNSHISDMSWPLVHHVVLKDARVILKGTDGYFNEYPLYISDKAALYARTKSGFLQIYVVDTRVVTSSPNMTVVQISGLLPHCKEIEETVGDACVGTTHFSVLLLSRKKDILNVSVS